MDAGLEMSFQLDFTLTLTLSLKREGTTTGDNK